MHTHYAQSVSHSLQRLNIKPAARLLLVSIERQRLELVSEGAAAASFPVSTSERPPSCVENSLGTPLGLHCIDAKIGHGAPEGEVFVGRVAQGRRYWELPPVERQPNLITSRILWLRGLEPGRNSGPGLDSRQRYIYLHGTNHEDRVGQPTSGGCILLRNAEMIELFNLVSLGDLVFIAP